MFQLALNKVDVGKTKAFGIYKSRSCFLKKISMKKVKIAIFRNDFIFKPQQPYFWGILKVLILFWRTV